MFVAMFGKKAHKYLIVVIFLLALGINSLTCLKIWLKQSDYERKFLL